MYFVWGGGGGEFPPRIPNLKIAKFWGGAFPPKMEYEYHYFNINLVSGKAYNLEYKNG
jgi:hypothetical protein